MHSIVFCEHINPSQPFTNKRKTHNKEEVHRLHLHGFLWTSSEQRAQIGYITICGVTTAANVTEIGS